MGFMDRLGSVTRGIGEETVRVVDYDKLAEERAREPKEPKAKEPRPRKVREPRPRRERTPKVKAVPEPTPVPIAPEPIPEPMPEITPEPVWQEPVPVPEPTPEPTSAFEVEEELFSTPSVSGPVEEDPTLPRAQGNTVQDVLELLNIPVTFEIEPEVFLPEDLTSIHFDLQVPQGYEMGQVDSFTNRVRLTVAKLVELLQLRNEHVALLATTVDRLQVDANNHKFQAEMANGINIMPTADNDELLLENETLRALLAQFQEEAQESQPLSTGERELFEALQDQVSVLSKEMDALNEENYTLKNSLAMLQEEQDSLDELPALDGTPVHSELALDGDELPSYFPQNEEDGEDGLPPAEEALPEFDGPIVRDTHIQGAGTNSAFFADSESMDDFMAANSEYYQGGEGESIVDFLGDNGETSAGAAQLTYVDPDADDELDAIITWDRD